MITVSGNQYGYKFLSIKQLLSAVVVLFMYSSIYAQTNADTGRKVPINILNATLLTAIETDSGSLTKLIGDVQLQQDETLLYCDSAYFFLSKNNVEAFGNVQVIQPGSQGTSDYMRYLGDTKMAYMRGNVMLTDFKSRLWSEDVTYNTGTKIGTYGNGGTLQDSTTTLSSTSGIYDMQSKNARFTGDVYVNDPQYEIRSDDMGYNTETKVTQFYGKSVVISDSTELKTTCGVYDSKNELATFPCRSSVLSKEQFIEADLMHNNRKTGDGWAEGKVVAIDTEQHTTLYSDRADFNERKKTILATVKPVMKQMNGNDSFFIRADTLYSAPVPIPYDTMKVTITIGKGKSKRDTTFVPADTAEVDSKRPRYFIGYHNVLIFSDSMQGKCDSISYSEVDSVMRMMYDPIVWSRKSQMTGDTIYMYMDSGKVDKIYIPNNSFVISQSGPEKAGLFDQVQGKMLTAKFVNDAMHDILVKPDAMVIQYSKDEGGAYLGVNEVTGDALKILFKDDEIENVIFVRNVKQKLTPMEQANLPEMKLSRFQWHEAKRPKKLEELFR